MKYVRGQDSIIYHWNKECPKYPQDPFEMVETEPPQMLCCRTCRELKQRTERE